jgi:hypothetical protein
VQRKSNTRTMQETTSSLEDDDVFKASSCYILSETSTVSSSSRLKARLSISSPSEESSE